ncbi:anaerobic ribonucleoside-triphosphate reductase activating protein [Pseudomonas paraeruginosa]|uniref:Anaerobic ribonucleoside-triphosphate reductase activating protein n=1 Tax=Pseudomonas aeruginosa TaxID=287 RepID=A0ABD7JU62_PSEAI|nr:MULTISPECIES: anaerobic ribonucleoside-triphosphate reductase activating protein [Pseudomonas aeruginosa group]RTR90902.1 anaerobic ribonucleoside-triphosphate reductase activating protein [Pseudomonas paraeruginosa]RTS40069.1 anaerobic ribonucleoside-triphosphate reductase activating protein [Pseudomonas aeruginosa]
MSATLRVGGVVPLTTLDYPGLLACVLFCQGCAWRCRYCHNPELIASRGAREIPWAGLLDFLRRRQGLLQAVVFSGGEATLQAALGDAMRTVRELGFRVGLHSAGINSRAFARVLAHTDWVGFDVKALAEDVAAITGVRGSGAANWRSLERLLDSGVAYECRTTVHWRLFDSERLWRLATRLRGMGVERFAVQLARPARQLDPTLLAAPAPQGAPQLWRELEALFPAFELRDA